MARYTPPNNQIVPPVRIEDGAAGDVGLIIEGASGQTADLQQWQNFAGSILARIEAAGKVYTDYISGQTTDVVIIQPLVNPSNNAAVGMKVKGLAAQFGDLQQWQNSAAAVLTRILADGGIVAKGAVAGKFLSEAIPLQWGQDDGTVWGRLNYNGSDAALLEAASGKKLGLSADLGSGGIDVVIDTSGNLFVNFGRFYGSLQNSLTTGEEVFERDFVNSNAIAMTSQSLRLSYFTARKSETTTQARVITGSTAAGATPTLCRLGLYSIDANGDGTLVASTPNDTALFAAANTAYTKAWSASYAKVAGQRYALGILVVTAAAVPTLVGVVPQFGSGIELNVSPRTVAFMAGQADLPATFLESGVGNSGNRCYGAVLPA
jgi:hypothetical protein